MEFTLTAFEPVADRVFRAVAQPASVTIGLVVGSTAALLVDTGSHPAQGREIRAAAQDVAGPVPLAHVVVTHAHFDHLFGLAAFADLDTWGHRDLAEALDRFAPEGEISGLGLTRDDLALPARTFSLAVTIDLGNCHAEVVHFGRGHTAADAVVIVPERGVVFVGDLLESAAFPSVGPDSHLGAWPRTLDGTLGTLRAASVIVPGHGPLLDQRDAFIQRAELAWVDAHVTRLWDTGVDAADAWASSDEWPTTRAEADAIVAVRFAQFESSGRPRVRRRDLPLLGR